MSDKQKDTKKDIMKKTDVNLSSKFGVFLKNEHHSFAVLKTEKLASALYMITGFVSETDPLRTRLRTSALELVSCVTDTKKQAESAHSDTFTSRCLEIGSMLCMAERAGIISSMNSKVLCEEYASLGSFVREHQNVIFGGNLDLGEESSPGVVRPGIQRPGATQSPSRTSEFKRTQNSKRHSDRRGTILSLFSKKDKINVKDAASAIDGCSEKTIQRELTAMVDEGVLLKEGERRWSVYKKAL